MNSVAIAVFTTPPIVPNGVLNMLIVTILAMGVFQLKYTKWHALSVGQHSTLNAWDWWAKKVVLRLKFQKVAGNMNRGMEYGINAGIPHMRSLTASLKILRRAMQPHITRSRTLVRGFQFYVFRCNSSQ